MKNHRQFLLSSVTLAVLTLMNQAHAAGQAAAEAPAAPARDSVSAEIQTVVVTGTAAASGVRKLDASYSITTANEEQLKSAAPSSTADLLKIVPGIFAEATGGVAGANIAVRGFLAGGVRLAHQGQYGERHRRKEELVVVFHGLCFRFL